jgi:hypothetical protein
MHPDHRQVRVRPGRQLALLGGGAARVPDRAGPCHAAQVDAVWQTAPGVGRDRMKRGILAYRAAYPDIRCAAAQLAARPADPLAAGSWQLAAGSTARRPAVLQDGRLPGRLLKPGTASQVPGAPRSGVR